MSTLSESLAASLAGVLIGSGLGWYYGYPRLGIAAGVAVGGAAGVAYATVRSASQSVFSEGADSEVVGFLPDHQMLIGGPGPWTPQRMLLASQMQPDRYGWAMSTADSRIANGPALARVGNDYGPAYLRMPYNATLPGSTVPPDNYFQQDVAPRSIEASARLRDALRHAGLDGEIARISNAYGVRFKASDALLLRLRQVAGEIARGANLAAVLVRRGKEGWAVYFTDAPSMLMRAGGDRIAGLGADVAVGSMEGVAPTMEGWATGPVVHYGVAIGSGAAAGATLAASKRAGIGYAPAILMGGAIGGGIAYLTRARKVAPPPGELPTERVGREAIESSLSGQTGRWLNFAVWGPMMIGTGYLQPSGIGSVLATTSGAVLMGSSALELFSAYRLKMKHKSAFQKRLNEYRVQRVAPAPTIKDRIRRLKEAP